MRILLKISSAVDRFNALVGQQVSWLILVAVLVSSTNAVVRKAFGVSSNAWLELQWYLFGAVFMLGAANVLLCNEHIRIDIFSTLLTKRIRDWIDLLGHLFFLLPVSVVMLVLSWPWFWRSYNSGEVSLNAGGLIIWPAKAMVVLGFVLLTSQAVSEITKRIAVLRGIIEDPAASESVDSAKTAEALRVRSDD